MRFLEWVADLISMLDKLEEIGISADDIEIALSPGAFYRLMESEVFARAVGEGSRREVGGVRFVVRQRGNDCVGSGGESGKTP